MSRFFVSIWPWTPCLGVPLLVPLLPLLLLNFSVGTRSACAGELTLFDASLGSLPGDQGWLLFAGIGSSQSVVADGVRLESSLAGRGGFSNHTPFSTPEQPRLVNADFPGLSTQRGFSLTFDLRLTAEAHTSQDRAGMSVILLAEDGRGIELGFWQDRIFAQNDSPLFVRGEESLIDTTSHLRRYELSILPESYTLLADGNLLLSGGLRDYSAFGNVPYTLGNYLFIGDNTTSASIDAVLGTVRLNSDLSAVPEPTSLALVAVGTLWLLRRRRPRIA